MSLRRVLLLISIVIIALSFTACREKRPRAPKAPKKFLYKPLDLSEKTTEFRRGAGDGCDTAVNNYTKDHNAFNTDIEYHNGWFAGRKNCENKPVEVEQ